MYRHRFFLLAWVALIAIPAHAFDGGVESLRQTGKAFAAVAHQVSPPVVFIQVESKQESRVTTPLPEGWPFGDDLFRRFFGDQLRGAPRREAPQERRRAVGQGSGFVFSSKKRLLSDKTYILTNNHVIKGADKIRVKFQDGREFDAQVTGTDPKSEVAVIEIKASGLPTLRWGDSSALEVGEMGRAHGQSFRIEPYADRGRGQRQGSNQPRHQ